MKPMDLDTARTINSDVAIFAFAAQMGEQPGLPPGYSLSIMVQARDIVRANGAAGPICDDRMLAAIYVLANFPPSDADACGELSPILATQDRALFLLGVPKKTNPKTEVNKQ